MTASVLVGSKCPSYRPFILLALLSALFPPCAWSQTQLSTVLGTVTDSTGAVIPGAQVTILNQSTGFKRSTPSDTNGQYRLGGLPPGMYTIRAEKEKFQTEVLEGIALSSGAAVATDLSLRVGGVSEQMTVYADVAIDNTTSSVSGAIAERSLTSLPLNSRDLFKSVVLEPGVAPTPSSAPSLLSNGNSGQVSINGARPSWTNVLIDGMDANDPVFGYSPAGASGLFLGLDDFAEVRVLTHTVGPEYGTYGGGVIEATTKSGTNQYHGSLFELHRDASLDAKNYFDLGNAAIPPFVRNQFGANIGGPIVHDRKCQANPPFFPATSVMK